MKNLLRLLLVAIFMIFVVNTYAVQPATKSVTPKVVKVQVQDVATSHITIPVHKTDTGKSQLVAALLAFFLGTLGIHNFYLGYKKKGMTQLLISIVGYGMGIVGSILIAAGGASLNAGLVAIGSIVSTLGWLVVLGVGIWAFIDFIKILTGDLKPANGDYTETL